MKDVGQMIRETRKRKGMTLQVLADKCGLSVGFLSEVERGLSSLSITSLWVITQALEVPISNFFELSENPSIYVKSSNHKEDKIGESSIAYSSLSGPLEYKTMDPMLIKVPPNLTDTPTFSHQGEEFVFVLEGEVVYTIGGEEYILSEGDSIHFNAENPHQLENTNLKTATALSIITTPLERGGKSNGEENVH